MMTRIGGFCAEHGAHLHRRGVRAQQQARAVRLRVEEERVVHVARRMAFREIELGEVVIFGLDVGAFGDGETHIGENRRQLVDHLGDRMDAADLGRRLAHRQRDVDAFRVQPRLERQVLQSLAASHERRIDAVLEAVDQRPLGLPLLGRQRAERFQKRGNRAVLAECCDAHCFKRGFIACGGDFGQDLLLKLGGIGHVSRLWRRSFWHDRQIGVVTVCRRPV